MPTTARTYSPPLAPPESEGRRQAGNTLILQKLLPPQAKHSYVTLGGQALPKVETELWTSKQRQASSLHEISYRACFKPQLPRFFIDRLTEPGDVVYDPFMGRGTTVIEAVMAGRRAIGNDGNPLSCLLTLPRLDPPPFEDIVNRLESILFDSGTKSDTDLSMFYHPLTEAEIVSLKEYFTRREETGEEDRVDRWIRMVATNRLTGHSPGFFSVYTLPPNQAVSQENQRKINRDRNQHPPYRDVKKLILKKSRLLVKDLTPDQRKNLAEFGVQTALFTGGADATKKIPDSSVQLTVTSPPFLDVVNYAQDNWLRNWFNGIDQEKAASSMTVVRSAEAWCAEMQKVFHELFRVTRPEGFVAFEVGEVRKKNLKMEELVVPVGLKAGFQCLGILINCQQFTKTSNIWGIHNNVGGTNTNRIVLFQKIP